MTKMTKSSMEAFMEAFTDPYRGYDGICACGKKYHNVDWYDYDDGIWIKDSTGTSDRIQYIIFDSKQYILTCDCWKSDAEKFITQLNRYESDIHHYYSLEAKRKEREEEQEKLINILSCENIEDENGWNWVDDIPF